MRVHGTRGTTGSAGARRIAALALALSPVLPVAAACSTVSGGRGHRVVRSLQEIRHDRVVLQKWDLSCGSAALSTLLTYDVGDPVSEPEIIARTLERADPVKI